MWESTRRINTFGKASPLVRNPLKLSTLPLCMGFPDSMKCRSTLACAAQRSIALLVNSVPLLRRPEIVAPLARNPGARHAGPEPQVFPAF
jgi:hypothetical protein